MRTIIVSLLIVCCLVATLWAKAWQDKSLVERFLKAGPAPCCDQPEPYSEELVKKPNLAPLLAEALKNPSAEIQKKQTSIIYMLGRMADPRVFASLASLYEPRRPAAFRVRLMISLGACLSETGLDQYLNIAVNDPEVLGWLEKTSGKACGINRACWKGFLRGKDLATFIERCRKLSEPMLG